MATVATGAAPVDWAQRFASHINPDDGSVVVPRMAAKWLHEWAPVPYERRLMLRERDPEVYAVIGALRLSALSEPESWPATSDHGNRMAKKDKPQQKSESDRWLTTRSAADLAGITDRAIRTWIATNRLPACRHGHAWRINRADLEAAIYAARTRKGDNAEHTTRRRQEVNDEDPARIRQRSRPDPQLQPLH